MNSVRNFNTIEILGNGQLAMMLSEAAKKLGVTTQIWSESPQSLPLNRIESASTITLENEFFSTKELINLNEKLIPQLKHYSEIETKLMEKIVFSEMGFDVTPYFIDFLNIKHFPIMLKLSSGGYDGYGNFVVKSSEELDVILEKLKGREVFWEPFLNIKKEFATQAVSDGEKVVVYPFVETIQKNSICIEVRMMDAEYNQLKQLIEKYFHEKKYKGTLAFEFIETVEGQIYFNESAPRVHNSGHYTMDLCEVGQFENHIRVCAGMPPAPVKLKYPFGGMFNILCKNWSKQKILLDDFNLKNCNYVDYFKEARAGRKMGHINFWGNSSGEVDKTRENIIKYLGECL